MDDARIGAAVRAVRLRSRLTQSAVAQAAGVTRAAVSRIERGHLAELPVRSVRRILGVLGMWLESTIRWRGADLDRTMSRAHSALQEALLRSLDRRSGWAAIPEVSYAIYGERGAIDILAWHEETRSLLIIELKTMLVDPAELVRTMDRRVRLAARIGRERGWDPATISTWVVLTDTRTNRRHVRGHARVLAPLAGIDGRRMRTWLRAPDAAVAALSFWTESAAEIHAAPEQSGMPDAAGHDGLRDGGEARSWTNARTGSARRLVSVKVGGSSLDVTRNHAPPSAS